MPIESKCIIICGDEQAPDHLNIEDLKINNEPSKCSITTHRPTKNGTTSFEDVVEIANLHLQKQESKVDLILLFPFLWEFIRRKRFDIQKTQPQILHLKTPPYLSSVDELITKVKSLNITWKSKYPEVTIVWCLPYTPDFLRYNQTVVKTANIHWVPNRVQISDAQSMAREFHSITKALSGAWSVKIPNVLMLDLNECYFLNEHHMENSFLKTDFSQVHFPTDCTTNGLNCSEEFGKRFLKVLEQKIFSHMNTGTDKSPVSAKSAKSPTPEEAIIPENSTEAKPAISLAHSKPEAKKSHSPVSVYNPVTPGEPPPPRSQYNPLVAEYSQGYEVPLHNTHGIRESHGYHIPYRGPYEEPPYHKERISPYQFDYNHQRPPLQPPNNSNDRASCHPLPRYEEESCPYPPQTAYIPSSSNFTKNRPGFTSVLEGGYDNVEQAMPNQNRPLVDRSLNIFRNNYNINNTDEKQSGFAQGISEFLSSRIGGYPDTTLTSSYRETTQTSHPPAPPPPNISSDKNTTTPSIPSVPNISLNLLEEVKGALNFLKTTQNVEPRTKEETDNFSVPSEYTKHLNRFFHPTHWSDLFLTGSVDVALDALSMCISSLQNIYPKKGLKVIMVTSSQKLIKEAESRFNYLVEENKIGLNDNTPFGAPIVLVDSPSNLRILLSQSRYLNLSELVGILVFGDTLLAHKSPANMEFVYFIRRILSKQRPENLNKVVISETGSTEAEIVSQNTFGCSFTVLKTEKNLEPEAKPDTPQPPLPPKILEGESFGSPSKTPRSGTESDSPSRKKKKKSGKLENGADKLQEIFKLAHVPITDEEKTFYEKHDKEFMLFLEPLGRSVETDYVNEGRKNLTDHEAEWTAYAEVPDLHPDYEEKYSIFLQKFEEKFGKEYKEQHLKTTWKHFWDLTLTDLKDKEWKEKKMAVQKEFREKYKDKHEEIMKKRQADKEKEEAKREARRLRKLEKEKSEKLDLKSKDTKTDGKNVSPKSKEPEFKSETLHFDLDMFASSEAKSVPSEDIKPNEEIGFIPLQLNRHKKLLETDKIIEKKPQCSLNIDDKIQKPLFDKIENPQFSLKIQENTKNPLFPLKINDKSKKPLFPLKDEKIDDTKVDEKITKLQFPLKCKESGTTSTTSLSQEELRKVYIDTCSKLSKTNEAKRFKPIPPQEPVNISPVDSNKFKPLNFQKPDTDSHKQSKIFSLVDALQNLEAISKKIGMMGVALRSLIDQARSFLPGDTIKAYKVFADSDSKILVNIAISKMKGLIGSCPSSEAETYRKTIRSSQRLLELAEKAMKKSVAPLPETAPVAGKVDVKAIAKATVGFNTEATYKFIKNAFLYKGLGEPSKADVHNVFKEVSAIHFNVAMGQIK